MKNIPTSAWIAAFAACLVAAGSAVAADDAPKPLSRATPESQGVSSKGVRAFVEAADKKISTLHSFMLVRHGKVVAEAWWKPQTPETSHVMWSLSKSFTSTAVGFAIAEGKFSLDDEVLKFFPEDAPANPSAKLKAMRVRDLLTMSTGHDVEPKLAASEAPWVKTFLNHPVPHKPGTHFLYNSAGTYMLSAIVQKTTGETVLGYLQPRLFKPLGISEPKWETSPQGVSLGGWGLFIRTEDVAKFGQLYLQKGMWEGKRILPEAWIETATSKQVSNGSNPKSDWEQGYGFQFWRCRHGAYRGDGRDGQFCIVLPEQDAVIAVTADTRDMQAELNVVWDELLSAFHNDPLPEDPQEQEKLKSTISSLAAGKPTGGGKAAWAGKTLENQTLHSKLLKQEMLYSVHLPAGYEESTQEYPVLYLLHGGGDDCTSWIKKGNLPEIADAVIREGKAAPMVVVMPDARLTYYMNDARGELPYEDYFLQELIPHVEKTHRCGGSKARRAVAGLSMGGYGSLLYALHHPDSFQSCYAMSAAVRTDEELEKIPFERFQSRYKALGEIKEGTPRANAHWRKNSVLDLVKQIPEERKKSVRFFLDCGDDDFLYSGNSLLHIALRDAGVPHEYRVRDGGHSWDYWKQSLPEALRFVAEGTAAKPESGK